MKYKKGFTRRITYAKIKPIEGGTQKKGKYETKTHSRPIYCVVAIKNIPLGVGIFLLGLW